MGAPVWRGEVSTRDMAHRATTPELVERFWSKVDRSDAGGCWWWTGAGSRTGRYGVFSVSGRMWGAHRASWTLTFGPIPTGLSVCHRCDHPLCVRPDHLFLGTTAENAHDAQAKGRLASGERHSSRTHPERLARGDRNGARKHPELLARGERHGSRTRPDRLARGARNGSVKHPELLRRGESHGRSLLSEADVVRIRSFADSGASASVLAREYGVARTTVRKVIGRETWRHVA